MEGNILHERLKKVIDEFIDDGIIGINYNGDKKTVMHRILSDSIQAINFINAIEEEFDIEFDDDDIDIEFFLSYDKLVSLIEKQLFSENL